MIAIASIITVVLVVVRFIMKRNRDFDPTRMTYRDSYIDLARK